MQILSIQDLNLEIASKSEPKIYKIQCLNRDIACSYLAAGKLGS